MIDCPIYMVMPGTEAPPTPYTDDAVCSGCSCGYIQYESLIPYLKEIRDFVKFPPEENIDFEFRLREQIVEISRLFDIAAGVTPGYFSKAHYQTTKIHTTNGTRYIKVPEHIPGTLEVRTLDDVLLDESSYRYENSHLVYMPCRGHESCGCPTGCDGRKSSVPLKWPDTCYKIRAKWGRECSDLAVQKAIRDYLIESYRMQDPVVVLANGMSVQRSFRVPHSWELYIKNFKDKRRIFNNYAIA